MAFDFNKKTFLILLVFLILVGYFGFFASLKIIDANSPDAPSPVPANTNIGVCIDPPYPDISNPRRPIFSWTTSGNSQARYWLQVDNNSDFSSPEINRNVASGNHSYQTPADLLTRKTTYWYRIAVRDAYGWTGWTGCNSFYLPGSPPNPPTNLQVSQPDYCYSPWAAGIFSWTFTDPDIPNPGDSQSAYRVQVDNNSDFSSLEWDSCNNGLGINTCTPGNSFPGHSTPQGILEYNNTYYWRVKVWDTDNLKSDWAYGPSFTTPKHAYPSIDFSWTPSEPSAGEIVHFTDQSIVYGGASKVAWFWTFQDGNPPNSNQQNATTTFLSTGPKQVTLRVTDSDGFACQRPKTVNAQFPLPEYKEIPPILWLKNFLANVGEIFKKLLIAFAK